MKAPGLSSSIAGYEGFEAVAFAGDRAYLTIEASPVSGMTGYLTLAKMAPDLSSLAIDVQNVVDIPSASARPNKSDEALLLFKEQVLTNHEADGSAVSEKPQKWLFDPEQYKLGAIRFPAVEYRITDVNTVDQTNRFRAINYFFSG